MEGGIKVISLWSPTAGTGTSFTAVNLALCLAKKGLKIALFDYDLASPSLQYYLNSEDNIHGLDNVIPFTAGGNLTSDILKSNLQIIDGIHFLRGTNSPEQAHYMTVESLNRIIEVAKEIFDYIIIDTQSLLDNAGTYVALESSDKNLIVMDKNVINIQGYSIVKDMVQNTFNIDKFFLIVNKCSKDIYMEKMDLEEYFGIDKSMELPAFDNELINAFNQGKWNSFVHGGGKQSKLYIDALEEIIKTYIDGEYSDRKAVKKSGFSIFGKK